MQETLPTITKTNTQSVIEIPVAAIIKPTIRADKNNYNIDEELKIIVDNMNDVNMALWECKYSLNGETAQNISAANNEYKYKLSQNGKYDFYFSTRNGDKSNTISTTVYNIVEFNDNNTDKWNLAIDNTIYYTNQKKIELQCPLKSSDLKVNGSNDNASFAGYRLVLGAEILSEEDYNVGYARRTIKITSAKVTKEGIEQSYYQMKGINGQTIKLGFNITKTDLLVEPRNNEITLSYRTNVVRMDRSDYSLSQVIGTEVKELDKDVYDSLEEAVKNAMDMSTEKNEEGTTVTYSIKEVTQDENGYYRFTKNNNYNLLFKTNAFIIGDTIPETIDPSEIKDAITLAQLGKNLCLEGATPIEEAENQDGNMVGGSEIETTLSNEFSEHYQSIYYRKHDGQVADITSITEEGLLGALCPQIGNEDIVYYDIILSDTAGLYPTVAAVVRIVKVTEAAKYTDILQNNIVSNGTEYYTINLFYNNEPTTVDFQRDDLDINGDSVNKEAAAFVPHEKIVFTIRGVNEERDVKCGYVNLDCLTSYKVNDIKNMSLDTLEETCELKLSDILTSTKKETINDNEILETYEYPAPDKEDNYLLYVYVTNPQKVTEAHISNGIIIDVTPPTIETTFYDNSGDEFDCPTEEKEGKHFLYGPITLDVSIEDRFTCITQFIVTATDKEGKPLYPGQDFYVCQKLESENTSQNTSTQEEETDSTDTRAPSYKEKYRLIFKEDANYTVLVESVDVSKNQAITDKYYFTIDNGKPIGTISVNGFAGKNMWSSLLDAIEYKLFNKQTATFEIEGKDELSSVTCYYHIAEEINRPLKLNELLEDDIKWEEYTGKTTIPADKREVVYAKIVDKAGNPTFISTDGLLTDTKEPIITYTVDKESNQKGFYKDDVTYSIKVQEVSNAVDGSVSGLKKVSYRILSDNKTTKEETIYENKSGSKGSNLKEFKIPVKASDNNNNDVRIEIEVKDMAGNEDTEPIKLRIDNKKPAIDVIYDNNNIINGEYYNKQRTAKIVVKERNLDVENDVKMYARGKSGRVIKIPQLKPPKDEGKSDDGEYTSTFTFAEDDDYEFFITCTDKAGNAAVKDWKEEFILDTTAPTIDVSYSGGTVTEGGYCKDAITATITIKEHNFDGQKVQVDVDGENTDSVPSVSEFRSNGDTHTATVQFASNGTYKLSASLEDKAGNRSESYEGSEFTVDLDAPKIEIKNISNQSAYKGDVKPVVTFTDENYDADKVSLTVVGANSGNVKLEKLNSVKTTIQNGEEYALEFPKDSSVDDLYTLTATIEDKAGNQKEEKVEFSINRYGSIYTLGSTTDKWLDSGVCSYLMEEKSIVIVETNVNDIESRSISYSVGGVNGTTVNVPELSECTQEEKNNNLYYKMTKDKKANGWVQYRYEIQADNFEDEGIYSITIHSKDTVGNETSNISNLHTDNKLSIQFAVDKTVPNVVFSGVEENALYKETEHTVLLDAQDNIALDQVTVYLNGKEYGKYSAEDIAKIDSGLISIKVPQSTSRQTVQVAARDMAGNMIGDVSSGEVTNGCEEISLLVTTNKFVQYMYTKWMWVATAIGLVLVSSGIVFLVFRKRRKK